MANKKEKDKVIELVRDYVSKPGSDVRGTLSVELTTPIQLKLKNDKGVFSFSFGGQGSIDLETQARLIVSTFRRQQIQFGRCSQKTVRIDVDKQPQIPGKGFKRKKQPRPNCFR